MTNFPICSLLYFSGTGNTAYVTEILSKQMQEKGYSCRILASDEFLMRAGQTDSKEADSLILQSSLKDFISGAALLILLFPTYGSEIPLPLKKILPFLPEQTNLKLGIISTIASNGGDCIYLPLQLLQSKNYQLSLATYIKMPNNFCVPYFPHKIRNEDQLNSFYASTEKAIHNIVGHLTNDIPCSQKPSYWMRIVGSLQRLVCTWFFNFIKKQFSVSSNCTQCRLCVESCPMSNITLQKGALLPAFSNQCCLCMRCYHFCPVAAIQISNKTKNLDKYPRYHGFHHWKPKRIARLS